MNKEDLVVRVAKTMYAQGVTIPRWDKEQDHVRFNYIGMAERFLNQLDEAGLEIVEKPKVAVEEKKATKEPKNMKSTKGVTEKKTKPLDIEE